MSSLARWNPFQELEELENRMASMYGRWPRRRGDSGEETMTVAEWAPLVDIIEENNEYLVRAELPGLTRSDIKVTMENSVLTVTGERKLEKEEKGRRYHRIERAYGNFARSFTLPEDADSSKINANFRDGLLEIHVAKGEQAKPKQIEVKVG